MRTCSYWVIAYAKNFLDSDPAPFLILLSQDGTAKQLTKGILLDGWYRKCVAKPQASELVEEYLYAVRLLRYKDDEDIKIFIELTSSFGGAPLRFVMSGHCQMPPNAAVEELFASDDSLNKCTEEAFSNILRICTAGEIATLSRPLECA